jgi:alkaline phosphatase D
MPLNRRETLALLGVGAATAPALAEAAAPPEVQFLHGVATGDPLSDRAIFWTRVTPQRDAPHIPVRLEVSEDENFAHIYMSAGATADPERDYTVKIDAVGLKPGHDYWYRFTCLGTTSPVGRVRTLPVGHVEKLALAFVTCSLYPNGYFNAYDHIARSETLDAVVELGDYIYEYGAGPSDYGMENGRKLGRIPEPPHDLVTLADYRTRYAQYRRDPDLQAAHARAPWICVWDDHEIANDTWKGGAENHHEKTEGAFEDRKTAAMRAYFEWMPIREPKLGRAAETIWRSFDFGDLASLTMLETRLTARSYQLEYSRPGDIPFIVYDATDPKARKPVRDPSRVAEIKAQASPDGRLPTPYQLGPDVEAVHAYISDPARQMMGAVQERWLEDTLTASVKSGKPWQLIGNEVIMARARMPDVEAVLGAATVERALAAMPEDKRVIATKMVQTASFGGPFDLDGWDGYPAARARFDDMVGRLPGGNAIVVSGDSHAFWANQLQDIDGKRDLAIEFGTSAITSPSIGEELGFQLGAVFMRQNREIAFCDQLAKGYVRLELTHEAAVGHMIAVSIDAKPYKAETLATWTLAPTPGPGVGKLRKS